jgi:hypothetical protein
LENPREIILVENQAENILVENPTEIILVENPREKSWWNMKQKKSVRSHEIL